ncbi:SH2 domain containing 3Cb isoform X2 [Paramormyrops kingsleyae]|uniref:SH2 domain containing 3Cb isoform X2 n=1 Tax=Paramormyrops kingsleyae TaxID=1676925 RepID=UPI003B979C50
MSKRKLSFKWFGSLSNLAHSLSLENRSSKTAAKHDGSQGLNLLAKRYSDDTEVCPHSPSHIHSSEACSHLATIPRLSRKEKKSKKSKKTGSGAVLETRKGDYVADSPLLSVLSLQGVSSGDEASFLDTAVKPHPVATRALQAEIKQSSGLLEDETASTSQQCPLSPEAQKMPPLAELEDHGQPSTMGTSPHGTSSALPEQSESRLGEAQESKPLTSHLPMDIRGEYVKFSKERYLLDTPPEKLRKELEEELKRSSDDMSSHGWYHGLMPREVSETLVLRNGDFLIRDSLTSMGDYVLTSRWNHKVLHFVIGKVLEESGTFRPRVQYQLGRESFDSVAALIHFYVGSQKPLSQESGAHIYCPINRTLPLRILEAAFTVTLKQDPVSPLSSLRRTFIQKQGVALDDRPRTLLAMPHRLSSSMDQIQMIRSPLSPLGEYVPSTAYNTISHHRSPSATPVLPSEGYEEGYDVLEHSRGVFSVPLVEKESSFKPGQYRSLLMPAENKPLEASILKRVKELLTEVDARTAAWHITKADCMVARILNVSEEMRQKMAVSSGLELLTLPHGQQLRLDLWERFHTMSFMMAAELLGCTGSREERAAFLFKAILLASELKSSQGNMFGFATIMRALELRQVKRLEQTWMTLRQKHTEGAILYEKKLKPYLKSMNEGSLEECMPSDTTFPHVVPLLSLLERGVAVGEEAELWEYTDMGVDVVMSHLETARTMAQHGEVYCSNAQTKLQGFQERPELLEIFLTEFQMRLLWGSRGVVASQTERYQKFDKVLTALSYKLEPPGGQRVERT